MEDVDTRMHLVNGIWKCQEQHGSRDAAAWQPLDIDAMPPDCRSCNHGCSGESFEQAQAIVGPARLGRGIASVLHHEHNVRRDSIVGVHAA